VVAITVEHEKRRKKILEKALLVFMDDGFENATFQKIADRCGITRTILYLYFKNKREIFSYSIKQLLISVEDNIAMICTDQTMNYIEKITQVLLNIIDLLEENRRLLYVVSDYLLHISKSDVNPEDRVRRRTVKLRRILSAMLIEGIESGELKKNKVKLAGDYLYSFIEAAIFQLVILKRKSLDDLRKAVVFAVGQFAAYPK
jgi:AcrR family transcriptional regulator